MTSPIKKTILNADGVRQAIDRLADEILEAHPDWGNLVLVGIRTGGMYLARRLQALLQERLHTTVQTGVIDINLYRDDWTRVASKPVVGKTELYFSIDDRAVVLVDDVLFTGRTVRAAMGALNDFGRPARIELAVLADRGHRELPICANYTGLTVTTTREERVNVYFSDAGEEDEVTLEVAG